MICLCCFETKYNLRIFFFSIFLFRYINQTKRRKYHTLLACAVPVLWVAILRTRLHIACTKHTAKLSLLCQERARKLSVWISLDCNNKHHHRPDPVHALLPPENSESISRMLISAQFSAHRLDVIRYRRWCVWVCVCVCVFLNFSICRLLGSGPISNHTLPEQTTFPFRCDRITQSASGDEIGSKAKLPDRIYAPMLECAGKRTA